jgi:hypothetical protein
MELTAFRPRTGVGQPPPQKPPARPPRRAGRSARRYLSATRHPRPGLTVLGRGRAELLAVLTQPQGQSAQHDAEQERVNPDDRHQHLGGDSDPCASGNFEGVVDGQPGPGRDHVRDGVRTQHADERGGRLCDMHPIEGISWRDYSGAHGRGGAHQCGRSFELTGACGGFRRTS